MDSTLLGSIRKERNYQISELDLKRLLANPSIENGKISHLIVKVIIYNNSNSNNSNNNNNNNNNNKVYSIL